MSLLIAFSAHGQINRCLDGTGRIVAYGTECPAGTRAAPTGIRTDATGASPAPAPRSLAEQEADFRKRQADARAEREKTEQAATEAAERTQACSRARAYLKALESGQRIARTDPKTGERAFLDDAEYRSETATARRAVETNCR